MIEFRCPNCNKLLGKIDGVAEIKCPRCRITFRMDNRNKIVIERLERPVNAKFIVFAGVFLSRDTILKF